MKLMPTRVELNPTRAEKTVEAHQGGAHDAEAHQGGAEKADAHQGGTEAHQGGADDAEAHQRRTEPEGIYRFLMTTMIVTG